MPQWTDTDPDANGLWVCWDGAWDYRVCRVWVGHGRVTEFEWQMPFPSLPLPPYCRWYRPIPEGRP